LNELVDFTAELARLDKELEAANKDKGFYENKLNNPGFVAKAPEAVVNQQQDLLAKTLDRIALLEESIAKIKAQI
jgi:valyl-tRNA synthetase